MRKGGNNAVKQEGRNYPGLVLLSHSIGAAVPSALEGLTAVFGMGTGVAPPLWRPKYISR